MEVLIQIIKNLKVIKKNSDINWIHINRISLTVCSSISFWNDIVILFLQTSIWASSPWNNQITLPFSRVSVVLFQIMKCFRDTWSDIIKTWLLCLSIMNALFETSSTEPANPAIGKDLSLMSQLWCVNNPTV